MNATAFLQNTSPSESGTSHVSSEDAVFAPGRDVTVTRVFSYLSADAAEYDYFTIAVVLKGECEFFFAGTPIPAPLDALRGADTLDVVIDAQFDYPLEAALETDVTSKSNSFIGPGITFKVSNNNLFRGGEVLAGKLNGSYEWQTGNKNSGGRSSRPNSYALGMHANPKLPQSLLPSFATRRQ